MKFFFQLVGDLFNFNEDYGKVNISETKDVTVSLTGVNKKMVCSRDTGIIFETFKDHKREESVIHKFGEVFCDTLNGKLAGFPKTYKEFEILLNAAQHYLALKEIWAINIAVSAYVNTIVPTRPYVGYPPNGSYTEVYALETETLVEAEESVMETLGVEHATYQSVDKLCLVMWANQKGASDGPRDGGFNFQRCK